MPVRFDPGNLTAAAGQLFSQSATQVAMVPGDESLKRFVDASLAEDPEDMTALRMRAERLLSTPVDDGGELLATLQRMRQIDPSDDDLNELTVQSMLTAIRRGIGSDVDITTLRSLIDTDEQLAELLFLQIATARMRIDAAAGDRTAIAGPFVELIDHAMELAGQLAVDPNVAQSVLADSAATRDAEGQTGAAERSAATWLAGQIDAAITAVGGTTDPIVREADERLDDYLRTFDAMSLVIRERLVDTFAGLPAGRRLARQTAAEAIDRGRFLEAERMLLGRTVATDNDLKSLDDDTLGLLQKLYGEVNWADDREQIRRVLTDRTAAGPVVTADDPVWSQPATLRWEGLGRTGSLRTEGRPCSLTHHYGRQYARWTMRQSPSTTIELFDPNGVPRTIAIEGPLDSSTVDLDAAISGGLLVVQTRDELIGVDLMNFRTGGDRVVRWRRSLATGSGGSERASNVTRLGDQIYRNRLPASSPGAARLEIRLGPVLGDRLLLLQAGRLVCLDTAEGNLRWSVDSIVEEGWITTDGQTVSVIDDRRQRIATFSLLDGSAVPSPPWEPAEVLATGGAHVLTLQLSDQPTPRAIPGGDDEIVDPPSIDLQLRRLPGSVVVLRRVMAGAGSGGPAGSPRGFGRLVDSELFVSLDSTGFAAVWDLTSGRSLADVDTGWGDKQIERFAAMRMGGRLVLIPQFGDRADDGELTQTIVSGTTDVAPASAVAVVDLATGELIWQKTFDETYAVTLTTPADCPVIGLVRSRPNFARPAVMSREVDLLILRVADGSEVARVEGKNLKGRGGGIDLNLRSIAHRGTVIGDMVDSTLELQFGGEP